MNQERAGSSGGCGTDGQLGQECAARNTGGIGGQGQHCSQNDNEQQKPETGIFMQQFCHQVMARGNEFRGQNTGCQSQNENDGNQQPLGQTGSGFLQHISQHKMESKECSGKQAHDKTHDRREP